MKKVVHQLNLDTVGGVENLFANYVGLSEGLSHELLVSSKRIHPQLKAAVESNTDVIKYIKTLKIGEKLLLLAPIELEEGRTIENKTQALQQQGYARIQTAGEVKRIDKITDFNSLKNDN